MLVLKDEYDEIQLQLIAQIWLNFLKHRRTLSIYDHQEALDPEGGVEDNFPMSTIII